LQGYILENFIIDEGSFHETKIGKVDKRQKIKDKRSKTKDKR